MGTRMFAIVKDMLKSVYNLNELSLSDMLEAAFEMYPVRVVCADIIAPMMWEIGSMWERGEIMVVMEHFASNVIIAKLKALLHRQNTTTNSRGPVCIVGCAPEEYHEIGALIVSFFMSLNGWKVLYLGQNIPTTDLLNIVDTMDVHTIALSASSERSLSSLKVIGSHIASRAKRKNVEFLVGGRLLKMGENMLESIPSATTRSADDLYAYCPPTHPTHQDSMVRGALDGSYSLIRESYRKMRLASERRKRTQYLLDQITDDSVGEPEKEITGDELTQEFSESLEKIAEFSCAPDDVSDEKKENDEKKESGEEDGECGGPVITLLSSPGVSSNKSPVISSIESASSSCSSPSTNSSPTPSDPSSSSVLSSPAGSTSPNSSTSSTSSKSTDESLASPTSQHIDNQGDIKERLEKQRKQTQAMKEMLKRYKDGKKAAADSIAKSRAFLNENRLVGPKKVVITPTKPATPEPIKVTPPAIIVEAPKERNYLVGQPKKPKTPPIATIFVHMHDPDAGEMFSMGPDKDEPYFPKYLNMPKVGDVGSRRGSNSSGMSDDDAVIDGLC